MSKLQSTLQRAIHKVKTDEKRQTGASDEAELVERSGEAVPTGVFRAFKAAEPNADVMEEQKIVQVVDDPVAKTAYNLLRTRVLHRMRSNNWRSILVTSPGAGEGKTLTAANLALCLAKDMNQSVVLVDLDAHHSTIAKYLGFDIQVSSGLTDFLNENASFEDIVYAPTSLPRIAIIPNRERVDNSSELLTSPRMKELLQNLRDQSENSITIFDMPPVLANDDVLAFCPNVDAVLLVIAQGQSSRDSLRKSLDMLGDVNVLGVVLNKSDQLGIEDPYGYY